MGDVEPSGMRIVRIPGNTGPYMVIVEDGRLYVVARLLGNSAERQARSARVIGRWADDLIGARS